MRQDSTGLLSNSLNPAWDVLRFGNETHNQRPPWPFVFFLTQIFLSQAAMFVNSLIFPPFHNSQFERIYKYKVDSHRRHK